jgi:hypothetical protein
MINFQIEEKEFSMIDSYTEMKLGHLIQISKIKKTNDESDLQPIVEMIAILSGCEPQDLDEMSLTLLNELTPKLAFLQEEIPTSNENPIVINGIDYIMKENMNDLTMSEYSSIKILQERYPDSQMDQLPYILAILIRPGTKTIKNETGKVKWKQEKFNSEDLEDRVEIFKKELDVKYISGVTSFFFHTKSSSQ